MTIEPKDSCGKRNRNIVHEPHFYKIQTEDGFEVQDVFCPGYEEEE
jgi:hypothetical protein